MQENIKLWLACYGELMGILVIATVILYDVFMQGIRGFFEWSIAPTGISVQMCGLALIGLGWLFRQQINRR